MTDAQFAARDRAVLDARKEARELRVHLERLTLAVRAAILCLDREMRGPSSRERGARIGKLLSGLELVNDSARHFGLGIDCRSDQEGKEPRT